MCGVKRYNVDGGSRTQTELAGVLRLHMISRYLALVLSVAGLAVACMSDNSEVTPAGPAVPTSVDSRTASPRPAAVPSPVPAQNPTPPGDGVKSAGPAQVPVLARRDRGAVLARQGRLTPDETVTLVELHGAQVDPCGPATDAVGALIPVVFPEPDLVLIPTDFPAPVACLIPPFVPSESEPVLLYPDPFVTASPGLPSP